MPFSDVSSQNGFKNIVVSFGKPHVHDFIYILVDGIYICIFLTDFVQGTELWRIYNVDIVLR